MSVANMRWGAPAEAFTAAHIQGVVVARSVGSVIGIKKLFEPLDELEIVLEPSFNQFVFKITRKFILGDLFSAITVTYASLYIDVDVYVYV